MVFTLSISGEWHKLPPLLSSGDPAGILEMMRRYEIETEGKEVRLSTQQYRRNAYQHFAFPESLSGNATVTIATVSTRLQRAGGFGARRHHRWVPGIPEFVREIW